MAQSGGMSDPACHRDPATGNYHCPIDDRMGGNVPMGGNMGGWEAKPASGGMAPGCDMPPSDTGRWSSNPYPMSAPMVQPYRVEMNGGANHMAQQGSPNLFFDYSENPGAMMASPIYSRPVLVRSVAPTTRVVVLPARMVMAKPAAMVAKPKTVNRHEFYFNNCDEAHAAEHTPLMRGDDGYRADLDPDGDGTACQ
jgi:hypothetical protein